MLREKQYKRRISLWRLEKNVRSHEMQQLLQNSTAQSLDPVEAAKVRRYVRRTRRPFKESVVLTSAGAATISAFKPGDVRDAVGEAHLAASDDNPASAEADLAAVRFPISQSSSPGPLLASKEEVSSQKADSEFPPCPKAPNSISVRLPPRRTWIFEQALLLERVRCVMSMAVLTNFF